MEDKKYQTFQLIFPGTKWCGTGNVAENYEDLGTSYETDMCCRDHDLCDDIIESGETNHNLTNNDFYTKLNCKCDEKFYDCLKSSHMKSAKAVGTIYFNVLGTQCYREDYPIVKCIKYHGIIKKRCVEYELDESQPKVYEWFDVPPF
ncbi:secretory Phospholipase A2 [Carabus blaptoides fortunei]